MSVKPKFYNGKYAKNTLMDFMNESKILTNIILNQSRNESYYLKSKIKQLSLKNEQRQYYIFRGSFPKKVDYKHFFYSLIY